LFLFQVSSHSQEYIFNVARLLNKYSFLNTSFLMRQTVDGRVCKKKKFNTRDFLRFKPGQQVYEIGLGCDHFKP